MSGTIDEKCLGNVNKCLLIKVSIKERLMCSKMFFYPSCWYGSAGHQILWPLNRSQLHDRSFVSRYLIGPAITSHWSYKYLRSREMSNSLRSDCPLYLILFIFVYFLRMNLLLSSSFSLLNSLERKFPWKVDCKGYMQCYVLLSHISYCVYKRSLHRKWYFLFLH